MWRKNEVPESGLEVLQLSVRSTEKTKGLL